MRQSVTMASLATDEPEAYGRFVLLSRLGTGGMAELWAAQPRGPSNLPALFALKRMLPADACKPEFVAMFVDEAKVIASLDHPNIARSFEYGQHGGLYYIAMELVRGLDLRRVQLALDKKGERIPMVLSVWIIEQVCEALAYAHATTDATGKPLNLIHRDISPHNLMVAFDGSVKVVDFGIAKTALQTAATRAGTLKGKVHYMSPEQARGDRIDRSCDTYAASICLWELLAGREAFEREESYLYALQRAQDPQIPKIREVRDDVPASLAAVLDKGLALAPEDRFQNAGEMAAALRKVCDALGGGGPVALASWLRSRFARIRDAQTRVLSHVGPEQSTQPAVDGDASTIRGAPIRPYDGSDANHAPSEDAPREGTEVFYSVDIDVELPERFDQTMPYAPLSPSASKDADSFGMAPTEVDDRPGVDLEELWVAFGTDVRDSEADAEIPVEHASVEATDAPSVEAEQTLEPTEAEPEQTPSASRPTDSPPPPAHPARSSGLVVGAAVIIGAAIVGAAVYFGPLGRSATGRIEIDAQIDVPFVVTVDGSRTGPVIGGLEPGAHEVEVSAEGYEELVRTVEVTPGATTIVAAALRPVAPAPVAEPPPPPEQQAPADASVDASSEEAPGAAGEAEEITPPPAPQPEPRRRSHRPRPAMAAMEVAMSRAADAAEPPPRPSVGEMALDTAPAAPAPNEPGDEEH